MDRRKELEYEASWGRLLNQLPSESHEFLNNSFEVVTDDELRSNLGINLPFDPEKSFFPAELPQGTAGVLEQIPVRTLRIVKVDLTPSNHDGMRMAIYKPSNGRSLTFWVKEKPMSRGPY